jgi:hypothetical protein
MMMQEDCEVKRIELADRHCDEMDVHRTSQSRCFPRSRRYLQIQTLLCFVKTQGSSCAASWVLLLLLLMQLLLLLSLVARE